mmetsp:Transcript_16164/g.25211  ORF Transcript_16164/g.25211 Transcript_16164/m.25211 type:complete len:221 (+) Transcript_16164:198-860(+)
MKLPTTTHPIQCLLSMLILIAFRAIYVFSSIYCSRKGNQPRRKRNFYPRDRPARTLVVLGSGGHTTEMLGIIAQLQRDRYKPITFIIACTDSTSERRYQHSDHLKPDSVYRIPRSREVGQSYFTSIFTTLWSIASVFRLVFWTRPDVLICNGPGTCIPVAFSVICLRILGWCEGKLIFVESFCRVESLSLTGRIMYFIADRFIVHWSELQEKYALTELLT